MSRQSIMRYLAAQESAKSLVRKAGSGRKASVAVAELISIIQSTLVECRGLTTIRSLCKTLANSLKGSSIKAPSVATLGRILKSTARRRRRQIKPLLTAEHIRARLAWARQHIEAEWGEDTSMYVFVDESQFSAFSKNRYQWVPHELADMIEPLRAQSKVSSRIHILRSFSLACIQTRIPSVMIFAGVARPQPKYNFSGVVGFFPVLEPVRQQRKSKYTDAGDWRMEAVTVTQARTVAYLKDMVGLIAERQKWVCAAKRHRSQPRIARSLALSLSLSLPLSLARSLSLSVTPRLSLSDTLSHVYLFTQVKKVTFQLDNAGGHGKTGAVRDFNLWAKSAEAKKYGRELSAVNQPANSPDFNILDLGLFNSIKATYKELASIKDSKERVTDRLAAALEDHVYGGAWPAAEKINKCLDTLGCVMRAVVDKKGGNVYKVRDYKK